MSKKLKYLSFLLVISFLLNNCAKVDPVTGEKILIETDPRVKSKEFVEKQGGLFGNIGKNK